MPTLNVGAFVAYPERQPLDCPRPMSTPRTLQRFAEVLLKAGIVDEMQLKSATAYCEQWGKRLPRVLAELGFANEDEVLEVLGQATRTPVVHLGNTLRDNGALKAL